MATAPLHGPYRIAGRVVDSLDGRPLRRAHIALFDTQVNGQPRTDVDANADGSFSLPDLPAGKFRVQASAPGYMTAAYDAHGQYSSAIVTGADVATESLVFRLAPGAAINGRVTDEAGDPVQNAAIVLFRENTDLGVRRITVFRRTSSNDRGDYEITRLPAGTYYASARATPWYATYPPDDAMDNNFGVAANVNPELSVAYPLTFYPEATESNGASAIALKPGDRFHADFHLTPQPALHLFVQQPEANPNNGRVYPQLQQKIFDAIENVPQQRMQSTATGVEIQGLAAGNYILRENGPNLRGGAGQKVSLTDGSVTVVAAPTSFGSLTLSLAPSPSPDTLPPDLQMTLHRQDANETGQARPAASLKDGHAEFANVEPGEYRIEPASRRFHVDSITSNGNTHSGALLRVTGSGQTVTITVGAGIVAVSGFARENGKGVSGVMMVLVPAGGDHSADLYRRDQSDLDGSFAFANVVPGNYLLVAIRDGWSLEWGKPEVLAPYLLRAIPVAVDASHGATLKIEEAVPVQAR